MVTTKMTTIIVTRDYLITDHRLSIEGESFSNFEIKNNVVVPKKRLTFEEKNDNLIKINILEGDEQFFYNGKRALAFTFSGTSSNIKEIEKNIAITKYTKSLDYLLMRLLHNLVNESCSILFYLEDGSSIIIRPKIKKIIINDYVDYIDFYGTGANVKHDLNFKDDFFKLPINEIFSVLAITDPATSLSYSVLGRKERMFYPYVKEPEEMFVAKAIELRAKYSAYFNPNNCY